MDQQASEYDLDGIRVEDKYGIFSFALHRAMSRGRYEIMERHAITASLQADDRVLELGAGCGVIGVAAARVVGPEAVTCVEANPALMPTIDHIHQINGMPGIRVINCAVAGEAGTLPFYVSKDFWSSSLSPETPKIDSEIQIEVQEINALITQAKANVIIADIEGAEFDLFEQIDLSVIDLVIIELHPTETNFAQVARFFRTLQAAGLYPDVRHIRRGTIQILRREARGD